MFFGLEIETSPTKTETNKEQTNHKANNKKHHQPSNKHLHLQTFYGFLLGPNGTKPHGP